MQRVDYVKKISTYLRRIYQATDPQEKLFFARELEKFVERNEGNTHAEPKIEFWLPVNTCKPRITAKDFIFLRDMKVSL